MPYNPHHTVSIPGTTRPYVKHRLGGWMPADPQHWRQWLKDTVGRVRARRPQKQIQALHPSIQALWTFIDTNTDVRMLFSQMLEQVPMVEPYCTNPALGPEFRDWREMLYCFDDQLTQGPIWLYNTEGQQGLIGFPFNAFLDWPMATPAGIYAFLRPDINKYLKAMLDEYGRFLMSPDSASVLNNSPEGWFNETALSIMSEVATPPSGPVLTFAEIYECDPSSPTYGFSTWDDFFTRKFRPGMRPVFEPDNPDAIVSCCESGPLDLKQVTLLRDEFWLKGQPYSLEDMLGGAAAAEQYVGGTVYQAFLSALSYHCWHAPVSGLVKSVDVIPGSYYAENYFEGFPNPDGPPDPAGPNLSQPYICQVAARGLMFIESDNPAIGEVAILTVGMAEVSTCEWYKSAGDQVTKGELIGAFHFGGSTHCLIFKPGVNLRFVDEVVNQSEDERNLPVCGQLATVVRA